MRHYHALLLLAATGFQLAHTSTAPKVFSTVVDYSTNQIQVAGLDFDPSGVAPSVTLGTTTLTLVSFSPGQITANLPAGLAPGTYRLTIINSNSQATLFNVTLGAAGPMGPP